MTGVKRCHGVPARRALSPTRRASVFGGRSPPRRCGCQSMTAILDELEGRTILQTQGSRRGR